MSIKDIVDDMDLDVPVLVIDGYDDAVIGMSTNDRLVYSIDRMCEILAEKDNISIEEASDHIFYNVVSQLEYDTGINPILIYEINQEDKNELSKAKKSIN